MASACRGAGEHRRVRPARTSTRRWKTVSIKVNKVESLKLTLCIINTCVNSDS
jgi:hypothetical protein